VAILDLRALNLLAPLLIPLTLSSAVGGASAVAHGLDCADEAPVTHHHELRNPECKTCVALDLVNLQ
jgi:hypothetical protein